MATADIILYTDGAALGNPGPGGYGVVLKSGPHRKELSGGFFKTTNNRMELLAVIVGLSALKKAPSSVLVYSDSKYVVDAVEKRWLYGWEKKGFQNKGSQRINTDLWKYLLQVMRRHQVRFQWVKGHAGNPENERCDTLAVDAAHHPTQRDLGYEEGKDAPSAMLPF